MSYQRISLDINDGIAVLRFNHPEVMNAVGAQMLDELNQALLALRRPDSGARCLLLTGTGRAFCAGANLTDPQRGTDPNRGAGETLRFGYHPLLTVLRELPMPVVTAVNGAAAGVGMSLALMGDIICAGDSGYFLQAFARIGLVPDGGATWLLPRLVGRARAMELSLLADKLPAAQALEWGLINRVFADDQLFDQAMVLARRLADGPRSLTLIRRAYWDTWQNSLESQLDLEARLQNEAGATEDYLEGVQAFKDKRPARFVGR